MITKEIAALMSLRVYEDHEDHGVRSFIHAKNEALVSTN